MNLSQNKAHQRALLHRWHRQCLWPPPLPLPWERCKPCTALQPPSDGRSSISLLQYSFWSLYSSKAKLSLQTFQLSKTCVLWQNARVHMSLGLITSFFLKAAICKLTSKRRPIQILWTSTTKQTELGLLQAAAPCGSPLFLQCMLWLLDITWRSGRPLFLFDTQRSKNLFSLLKGLHLDMVWIFN